MATNHFKDGIRSITSIRNVHPLESWLIDPMLFMTYLEICCKLFNFHNIVRLNVIPAPDELVETVFLAFLLSQYFWVLFCIVYFAQLF